MEVCHRAADYFEGVQRLAAHSQPPHHAAFQLKFWEAGMRDDGFTLHATCTRRSQQVSQGLQTSLP